MWIYFCGNWFTPPPSVTPFIFPTMEDKKRKAQTKSHTQGNSKIAWNPSRVTKNKLVYFGDGLKLKSLFILYSFIFSKHNTHQSGLLIRMIWGFFCFWRCYWFMLLLWGIGGSIILMWFFPIYSICNGFFLALYNIQDDFLASCWDVYLVF